MENNVKNYQVRNTLLDPDRNIWATSLISSLGADNEKKAASSVFFRSLEVMWSEMLENSVVFRSKLPDLTSLIMNELSLTAFTFYPSESFASFDLYPCLAEAVREKYGMENDQVK